MRLEPRYAVCNELFGSIEPERQFATIREAGFTGVELAPHTIFDDFSAPLGPQTARLRNAIARSGLRFCGLHWLLVGPPNLHATASDDSTWRRTWDHVGRLVDLAGELGGGTLVFGSPAQRASRSLMSREAALDRFVEGLGLVADRTVEAKCHILLEALGSAHTDVLNTLAEVKAVLERLDHSAFEAVFDFHNVEDEVSSWSELIRDYAGLYTHVHLNEPDGGAPAPQSANRDAFRRAFATLREVRYGGWISLEIFSEPDDPAATLRDVRSFLDSMEE